MFVAAILGKVSSPQYRQRIGFEEVPGKERKNHFIIGFNNLNLDHTLLINKKRPSLRWSLI
jgi:hypothetical protein